MYLLEGLVQWNEARGVAAVEGGRREDICYGGQMQQYLNVLSEQLLGHKMLEDFTSPGEYTGIVFMHICHIQVEAVFHQCVVKTSALYMVIALCISTGELIGVEYSQTKREFQEDFAADPDAPDGLQEEDLEGALDLDGDEGFEDIDEPLEFMDLICDPLQPIHQQTTTLQPPRLSSSQSDLESSLPGTATQSQVHEGPYSKQHWGFMGCGEIILISFNLHSK